MDLRSGGRARFEGGRLPRRQQLLRRDLLDADSIVKGCHITDNGTGVFFALDGSRVLLNELRANQRFASTAIGEITISGNNCLVEANHVVVGGGAGIWCREDSRTRQQRPIHQQRHSQKHGLWPAARIVTFTQSETTSVQLVLPPLRPVHGQTFYGDHDQSVRVMKTKLLLTLLVSCSALLQAGTTLNQTNRFAFGANIGWIDWRADGSNGAVIGEFVFRDISMLLTPDGSIWAAVPRSMASGTRTIRQQILASITMASAIFADTLTARISGGSASPIVTGRRILRWTESRPAYWQTERFRVER